jgi:hypothetical protein
MRYKDKDFIIASNSDELAFSLKGKGAKVERLDPFDGNEHLVKVRKDLGKFNHS